MNEQKAQTLVIIGMVVLLALMVVRFVNMDGNPHVVPKQPHTVTYETVCINNVTYLKAHGMNIPGLMLGTDSKVITCNNGDN